jgi:hypothetical protein
MGYADQFSSHLKECPYEQIRLILSEILTENHHLNQKNDQYENLINFTKNVNN